MTQNEIQTTTIEALTARETVLRGAILAMGAPGRTLGAWLSDSVRLDALRTEWVAIRAEQRRRAERAELEAEEAWLAEVDRDFAATRRAHDDRTFEAIVGSIGRAA